MLETAQLVLLVVHTPAAAVVVPVETEQQVALVLLLRLLEVVERESNST